MINYINRFINIRKLKTVINTKVRSGYEVKFWWRDDDISDVTEGLTNILIISEIYNILLNN